VPLRRRCHWLADSNCERAAVVCAGMYTSPKFFGHRLPREQLNIIRAVLYVTYCRSTDTGDVGAAAKVAVDSVPSVCIASIDGGGDNAISAHGPQLPLVIRESELPGWSCVAAIICHGCFASVELQALYLLLNMQYSKLMFDYGNLKIAFIFENLLIIAVTDYYRI